MCCFYAVGAERCCKCIIVFSFTDYSIRSLLHVVLKCSVKVCVTLDHPEIHVLMIADDVRFVEWNHVQFVE